MLIMTEISDIFEYTFSVASDEIHVLRLLIMNVVISYSILLFSKADPQSRSSFHFSPSTSTTTTTTGTATTATTATATTSSPPSPSQTTSFSQTWSTASATASLAPEGPAWWATGQDGGAAGQDGGSAGQDGELRPQPGQQEEGDFQHGPPQRREEWHGIKLKIVLQK